ncbi:dihydroneopterin aldolase [Dethiobacter alkaliphilus]|uniref:7,8-dihydroneopterin aldolase n=1 Tax=Dethiobacter alkaliphilus AHT 1 TaxID=555088 RepID=C0GCX8_DETAL|nr:dihydroneopterin aldolase [Dethiobacter alkaliphilus]EEG79063.1 dihydroneopterin aldolase [Dethiobacter alkaliphilus AHT 1]
MDKIILENMLFYGYHGVLPEENTLGQRYAVSVVLGTDIKSAAADDDLTKSLNYAEVYNAVKGIMEGEPAKLLETLAESISGRILAMGAETVRVTVKKLHPPIPGQMDFAAVEIERSR